MPKPDTMVRLLLAWFGRAARDLPWRRTAEPYAVWISEVMLQQTQVKTVVPYWERWMRTLPTIGRLARARPERILKLWEGLGYYSRARNLQRGAREIVARHGGRFPQNFSEVLALPGIGRYTAGAICSIAFNQPTPIVDGNVTRVLTRVFGLGANPREPAAGRELWRLAGDLIARADRFSSRGRRACAELNQALMELGATVCVPRSPSCPACPLRRLCVARQENRVTELPNLGPRGPTTSRRFVAFVVEHRGRFLVRRRPLAGVNARLWEFPNLESGSRAVEIGVAPVVEKLAGELLGTWIRDWRPFGRIKHSITRYRITLHVFRAALGRAKPPASGSGRWCSLADLRRLTFTAAHRRIVRQLSENARGRERVGGISRH